MLILTFTNLPIKKAHTHPQGPAFLMDFRSICCFSLSFGEKRPVHYSPKTTSLFIVTMEQGLWGDVNVSGTTKTYDGHITTSLKCRTKLDLRRVTQRRAPSVRVWLRDDSVASSPLCFAVRAI